MNISRHELNALVNSRYVKRGEQIVQEGSIVLDRISSESIHAYAIGTGIYQITLSRSDTTKQLTGICSCPAFLDFGPCKHIAAAGLARLQPGYMPDEWCCEQKENFKKTIYFLNKKTKTELIETILRFVAQDQDLLDSV